MTPTEKRRWNQVKAAIIRRYGTLALAAEQLNCSVEGMRMATVGRCPGVLQKLRESRLLTVTGTKGTLLEGQQLLNRARKNGGVAPLLGVKHFLNKRRHGSAVRIP